MAMGRGLTLQIEDGSYSLNSWNSIQPGRVKKSTETRQSHGKKLGGHFQLAVNFQKPKLPAKQLVTPASLMSSTLQPGQKSLSKDRPNFEDAAEDTFSEDEDSSQDEENDDDDDSGDSGDQRKGAYNYRDSIPVLSDGGDGSSVNSSDEEEYSSHAEEVRDAIDSMEEIQREELGFTLLKDSNRPEDDSTRDKRKVVSLLGSMSPSSDKENLTDDTIVRVKGSDRNQSLRSSSSEQMATGLRRSDLHNFGNGQSKQPLTDSANTTIKTGNKPLILNENAGRGSSQSSSLDRNKRNVDYTVTGIQQENLLISVPPKGGQLMSEKPMQGQGSSTGITGGALARSKFENARLESPSQTDLKISREGSPGFPEMTVNKPTIRNNRNPLSEMPTTSFTGVRGTDDRAGRTQAPVISERGAGQDNRRGGPSQDGGGGIVSTRIQPSGKLSDAERTNEYEWRKFKVVRKVKKVLKSGGAQAGKPRLPEDVTDQLLEIIINMSDSFLVFEDKPQEVAIVLEEVILQAVEETAEDDDYQREFITLLQKLSSIIKNFEKELKSVLKLVEAKHIQAFTGAHTEKMGLSYCRFLGRLLFGFSVLLCPTKVMLEELISLLTNKWIIFNEKGTNPNAEATEMSFAKCLKVVMKEIGPCYPEKKWKNLLEAVRGQIFGKRSQTVKEIFLEILLHSETLPRSSTAAEPVVNRTNEPADLEVRARIPKKRMTPHSLMMDRKLKRKDQSPESGISEESPVIDVGKSEPKSPSPSHSPYNDSMKATYLSTKVRCSSRGRDHANDDDVKSQTMGSGTVERNKTAASDNREAFDWWDLETVNEGSGHLRKEKDAVREVRDDCISKQDNLERIKHGQHETKQGHHVPKCGHHVSKMDHQAPKEGHRSPTGN
ncbi:hypothetical protein BSL78_12153 [Apostichopus japonicus]|uniref:Uncharacterized protein n=1 Tax=Stichopus japonicus TaxID=307972 RepID=A0A2G8KSQ0_STIJA|nr:hypothetical protein BSL78_12153 [Apostichopus japonicus]